jgi:hypothetical protein
MNQLKNSLQKSRPRFGAVSLAEPVKEDRWLRQYGRHLNELFQPIDTLPTELAHLLRAISDRVAG